MLSRIQQTALTTFKKENLASQAIDHLKNILAKMESRGYKPWKNDFAPSNPHSPLGDFPPEYISKSRPHKRVVETSYQQDLSSTRNKYERERGTGGRTSSTLEKIKQHRPPKPVCGAFKKRQITVSEFRRYYDRGDLPIKVDHQGSNKILWKTGVDTLDYHHFLPIFFDGLREKMDPYRFLAILGTTQLLQKGGGRILPVIPQLIIPIKTALNTRDPQIMGIMLKTLQRLVLSAQMIGEALVPYYRQILPIMNIFKSSNLNIGDKIDYNQRKRLNLGDLILQTLQLFEQTGGQDAFINIKYMIPTYESCIIS